LISVNHSSFTRSPDTFLPAAFREKHTVPDLFIVPDLSQVFKKNPPGMRWPGVVRPLVRPAWMSWRCHEQHNS
jgi:hypothetical protein